MGEKIRLYCPNCEEEISLDVSKKVCPKCNKEIKLKSSKVKCPCDKINDILIPESSQVFETHYADYQCLEKCNNSERKKKRREYGNLFWLKCPEYSRQEYHIFPSEIEVRCTKCNKNFHISLVDGETSTSLLTDRRKSTSIPPSLLSIASSKSGKIFEKLLIKLNLIKCNRFITSYMARRLGEIIFCISIGLLLATIYPILIFWLFGFSEMISFPYMIFTGGVLGASLYFSLLILKEISLAYGEIETNLKDNIKTRISIPFFVFNKWIFVFVLIILTGIVCFDELYLFGLNIDSQRAIIGWVDNLAVLGRNIIFSLVIPIYFGFGFFLYWLWDESSLRPAVSLFKHSFLNLIPSIEKLGEIILHIIIFFASVIFINEISLSYFPMPLYQMYSMGPEEIFFLYKTLLTGLIILLPLVLYFLYLGKLTTNLKAIELKRINNKINKLINLKSEEKSTNIEKEQSFLLSYRNDVNRALRWIRSIEYGSRLSLLFFVALESYFISKIFV